MYVETNHSEQRSMLEIWVELHQSWLCARLPLNKTTEERTTRNIQCAHAAHTVQEYISKGT